MTAAWRAVADGVEIAVRLTPRGGRDAIDGVEERSDGTAVLAVRVRAVPEDGRANAALVRLIAQELGVAASKVVLTRGATARIKMLHVAGDSGALAAALAKAAAKS